MIISVKVQSSDFTEAEVTAVIAYAIRTQAEQAGARRNHYQSGCSEFETKYNMSSDEFMERFESGELGDDEHWFSWYAAKSGFDNWDRYARILNSVTL
jgi:hypothetical protein